MIHVDFNSTPNEDLLIGSLVNRAAILYTTYGDCNGRCSHPSGACNDNFCRSQNCKNCSVNDNLAGREDCYGCCLECSEEVHYHRSWRSMPYRNAYDCQKLIYYYTCRYSWKYCSEIIYALESIDLSKYGTYSVLSLGCGQSPDLMAIEQVNRFDGKGISYIGYDINPYWATVHNEIKSYSRGRRGINCHYEIVDVLESLDNSNGGFANIIVMSYLLSSFPDSERPSNASWLFDLIISKVLAYKGREPVLIIINDIDHNTMARNYFDIFLRKLQLAGHHGNVIRRHFGNRNGKDYGDGSAQYDSSANKFLIPYDIGNDFNCAIQCTSAQCIIEVN